MAGEFLSLQRLVQHLIIPLEDWQKAISIPSSPRKRGMPIISMVTTALTGNMEKGFQLQRLTFLCSEHAVFENTDSQEVKTRSKHCGHHTDYLELSFTVMEN